MSASKKQQPNKRIRPPVGGLKGQAGKIIVPGRARIHTKVTPAIMEIAVRFPGNDADAVKRVAKFVSESTHVRQTVFDARRRYKRSAEDVLRQHDVDLLHCHDRGHALISVLTAKKIPAWMVVSIDFEKFVHSYVEAMIGKKVYTIAFKVRGPPIFAEGGCEKEIKHAPGTSFVRGRELADFGVRDKKSFDAFAARLFAGKVKDKVIIKP